MTNKKAIGIVQAGFSLIELLIAMAVFLVVSAIVLTFMFDMTRSQATTANRTEMHSSVRSVTEVMQQEISQAGRIAIPGGSNETTLGAAVTASTVAQTVGVGDTSGMFDGMLLSIAGCPATGACPSTAGEEIVKITIPSAGNISGIFTKDHAQDAVIRPSGAFPTGILTTTDGNTLKMFGDINDDGNMVYVVYTCNPTDTGTGGTLTRIQADWDAATLPAGDPPVLINNLATNYDAAGNVVPCFAFQTKAVSYTALDGVTIVNDAACAAHAATAACTAVVNVAVTLTVRAEQKAQPARADDPATPKDEQYDYETKALLTVAPRNVFQAWEMSTMSSAAQHMEPTPTTITTLTGL